MGSTDTPLVTVITPARNMERFLRSTIRSVLAQSFTDFEYLVVDNASDDATGHIVASVAAHDHRVRLLHEARCGSAAARNLGLAEARGRYVAFVDGDDVWLPDKLERQLEQLVSLPPTYSGVFCRSVTTTEDGEDLFVYRPPVGTYDLDSFLAWFYPPGNGSSFLLRREAIDAVGGFDESLDNLIDVEWLLRVLRDSSSPLLLGTEDTLVRYRQRRGSISTDAAARMRAMETVIGRFDVHGDPLVWMRPALMAYRMGCVQEGRSWARRAGEYGWHRLLRSADGRRLLAYHLRRRFDRSDPISLVEKPTEPVATPTPATATTTATTSTAATTTATTVGSTGSGVDPT